ncbi:MAG: reverse transcriptase domain-containing protein [bacterium]|nr:reverse transcriptase domain-containing protein [bacterium]
MITVDNLCRTLGYEQEELENLVANFSNLVIKRRKRKRGSNGYRLYLAPEKPLLLVQRTIKKKILENHKYNPNVRGLGGKNNSHVNTALEHSTNHEIVRLDIVDFYDSINVQAVFRVFKDDLNFDSCSSKLLVALTTFEGRLWQGLPTSSHLAIVASSRFTSSLSLYAYKNGLTFSQYGDDLFFSGSFILPSKISAFVIGEARKFGLRVQRHKISVDRSGNRRVTGILSGASRTRAPKEIRKKTELLAKLYFTHSLKEVEPKLRGYLQFVKQCWPLDAKKIVDKYKLK